MSDRINSITVVLDHDMRDDDCSSIVNAIVMIKGVLSATPNVADIRDHTAAQVAKAEIWKKIVKALEL